jgi:hypothetical protein
MTARVVELTDAEQRIVRWVAKMRHESNRAAHVRDGKVGPQSAMATDEIGIGAEVAFCKLHNLYPDLEIRPRQGSADCERFGEAIDVKGTKYANGELLAVRGKSILAADVYALVIVDWPRFRFAGFARAEELIRPERLTDKGHGPTYALAQGELFADQIRWGVEGL